MQIWRALVPVCVRQGAGDVIGPGMEHVAGCGQGTGVLFVVPSGTGYGAGDALGWVGEEVAG